MVGRLKKRPVGVQSADNCVPLREMKKKILFPVAVFAATVAMMAVQKPLFLLRYAELAAAEGFGAWCRTVWHGLSLDMTVAGYVTALPLLAELATLWVRLPERFWRGLLTAYFTVVSLFAAAVVALGELKVPDAALVAVLAHLLDAVGEVGLGDRVDVVHVLLLPVGRRYRMISKMPAPVSTNHPSISRASPKASASKVTYSAMPDDSMASWRSQ